MCVLGRQSSIRMHLSKKPESSFQRECIANSTYKDIFRLKLCYIFPLLNTYRRTVVSHPNLPDASLTIRWQLTTVWQHTHSPLIPARYLQQYSQQKHQNHDQKYPFLVYWLSYLLNRITFAFDTAFVKSPWHMFSGSVWDIKLIRQPRMARKDNNPCLNLRNAGITGITHYTQPHHFSENPK